MERVGHASGFMSADILQARSTVIKELLPGIGHRGDRRDAALLQLRQNAFTGLIEDSPLVFQVAGGRCIGWPDNVSLGVVKAGQRQRRCLWCARSSRSGSFAGPATERAELRSDSTRDLSARRRSDRQSRCRVCD